MQALEQSYLYKLKFPCAICRVAICCRAWVVNTAEIAEDYNILGLQDKNPTPGNKSEKENDLGSANVVITVRTGQIIIYTTLIISVLGILFVGIYSIKKYVIKN